jgi:hypothetical protein
MGQSQPGWLFVTAATTRAAATLHICLLEHRKTMTPTELPKGGRPKAHALRPQS